MTIQYTFLIFYFIINVSIINIFFNLLYLLKFLNNLNQKKRLIFKLPIQLQRKVLEVNYNQVEFH